MLNWKSCQHCLQHSFFGWYWCCLRPFRCAVNKFNNLFFWENIWSSFFPSWPFTIGKVEYNCACIAASLFVWNWLSWQIVLDDKIQITILILKRGALSTRDHNWSRISRNRSWDWCLGGLIDHSPEFTRIGVEIVGMGEGGPGRLTVVKSREKAVYGLGRTTIHYTLHREEPTYHYTLYSIVYTGLHWEEPTPPRLLPPAPEKWF